MPVTDLSLSGPLKKLKATLQKSTVVSYEMPLGDQQVSMNALIGSTFELKSLDKIECIHCHRITRKSFNQGYCYPCFMKLAQCDQCIMKPELCHYHKGTCREPEWGERFCMTDHIVYLANSSGIKVGITRLSQVPVRWIDQGAIQALPVFRVATRQLSGFVEDLFRNEVNDRTNWRAMLKGDVEPVNLVSMREKLFALFESEITALQQTHGINAICPIENEKPTNIEYPVSVHPEKISSLNFDKTPLISGKLLGIKGQYLILDTGVLNIRKFTGYHVSLKIIQSPSP